MDPFQAIVENVNLYPIAFRQKFGESSQYWGRENWQQRELSLRHDMVCCLLCNMTPMPQEKESDEPPAKRARISEEPSTSSGITHPSDPSSSSSDEVALPLWEDWDEDEEMEDEGLQELMRRRIPERRYRFIVLEGKINIPSIQAKYARRWGTNNAEREWDIIDKVEKKFVEVKVTVNFEKAYENYDVYSAPNEGFTSLFLVHPNHFDHCWYDNSGNPSGESKVKAFLSIRRALLDAMGVVETISNEQYNLTQFVFRDGRFNDNVKNWISPMLERKNEAPPPGIKDVGDGTAAEITPKDLLDNIEDPRLREIQPVVKWEGKLIPMFLCDPVYTSEDKDAEMVESFLEIINEDFNDETPHGMLLMYIKDKWDKMEEKSTFKFLNPRELPIEEETGNPIRRFLGLKQKKHKRDDEDKTTQQQPFSEHQKLRYHPWFDCMMEDLAGDHDGPGQYFTQLAQEEMKLVHPMDKTMEKCFHELVKGFGASRIGEYCSQVGNLYSRLGGSYLGDNQGNPNHNNISIFPLCSSAVTDTGARQRSVSGICIRAPHHATMPSDRINFITIERISPDPKALEYSQYFKSGKMITISEGSHYFIRSNAINKADPSYLSFIESVLFVAANLSGEIIMTGLANHDPSFDPMAPELWIMSHNRWLMERIVESALMATLGGSQEEGTFAIIRKIFMVMLAWSRGDRCMMWNPKELCEKLNECIIDHPLAMHYVCSIIDIVRSDYLSTFVPFV